MDKIHAYTEEGYICFDATNITEYKDLIELAQKQAQQLNDTVARLNDFKFKFKFSQIEK